MSESFRSLSEALDYYTCQNTPKTYVVNLASPDQLPEAYDRRGEEDYEYESCVQTVLYAGPDGQIVKRVVAESNVAEAFEQTTIYVVRNNVKTDTKTVIE